MRYRIAHKTDYRYGNDVAQSNHLVHLSPRQIKGQTTEQHQLIIRPAPGLQRSFLDYFGNPTEHLTIEEDHDILSIEAISIINVERDHNQALSLSLSSWELVRDAMRLQHNARIAEFACVSPFTSPTNEIANYGRKSFPPGRPLLEGVMDLTSRIFHDFDYDSSVTDVSTPVSRVFELKGGVCQDFAHLQLTCLRALGLPARYVSGYLRTYPPEGQPRLIGADASHAWISVWSPEAGWVDFDPTNNKMIADEHITLSVGRDFTDVSPISGIILGGGASHYVDVSVDVMPIDINGNEIGRSVAPSHPSSADSTTANAAVPASTQSQRNDTARQQEQSQEQIQMSPNEQGELESLQPPSTDYTY